MAKLHTEQEIVAALRKAKKMQLVLECCPNVEQALLTAVQVRIDNLTKAITHLYLNRATLPNDGIYGRTWEEIDNG